MVKRLIYGKIGRVLITLLLLSTLALIPLPTWESKTSSIVKPWLIALTLPPSTNLLGLDPLIALTLAAYDLINKEENDANRWLWFWKLKVPAKLKTFIWLIMPNRLPTNQLRATPLDICPRCREITKDMNHPFRGRNKAKDIWSYFQSSQWPRSSFQSTILDWITCNLKSKIWRYLE